MMYFLEEHLLHFHSLQMRVFTSSQVVVVARFEQFYGCHTDSFRSSLAAPKYYRP